MKKKLNLSLLIITYSFSLLATEPQIRLTNFNVGAQYGNWNSNRITGEINGNTIGYHIGFEGSIIDNLFM